MKKTALIIPQRYIVRQIDDRRVEVILRTNIKSQQSGSDVMYTYDEYRIEMPIRKNINQYIEENFNNLIELGKSIESKEQSWHERKETINQLIDNQELLDVLEFLIDKVLELEIRILSLENN